MTGKGFSIYLILFLTANCLFAEDWPTYRHDNHRSGHTREQLDVDKLGVAWTYRPVNPPRPAWPGPAKWDAYHAIRGLQSMRNYDPVFYTVVVGARLYYSSSADDSVHCLDTKSGVELWVFPTDAPLRVSPAYADGKLYFGSDDGFAYCVSATTGVLIWKRQLSADVTTLFNNGSLISCWPCRTGVLVEDGVAYCAASLLPWKQSLLCALDAKTGRADGAGCYIKKIEKSTLESPLLTSSSSLIIMQGRSAPRIFNRATGEPLGTIGKHGGSIALITDSDQLYHGPGPRRGEIFGSKNIGASTQKLASYARARAMVAANGMSYISRDSDLLAFDRKTGKRRWRVKGSYPCGLILAGQTLFAGGRDEVAAFNISTGKKQWSSPVFGRAHGLTVAGGSLYVSTDTGEIVCFRPGGRTLVPQSVSAKKKPAASGGFVDAGVFKLGPYLQFTEPHTAHVRWLTATQGIFTVAVVDKNGEVNTFREERTTGNHDVLLTGLRENELYRYTISGDVDGVAHSFGSYDCDTAFNYSVLTPRPYPVTEKVKKIVAKIVAQAPSDRGIAVVLGCRFPDVLAALTQSSRFTVIGVDVDAKCVASTRHSLLNKGSYGPALKVRRIDSFSKLPFPSHTIDFVVNLLGVNIPEKEIERVLAPGGSALLSLKTNDKTVRKSALSGAGMWTHMYGMADNATFGGETLANAQRAEDMKAVWMGRPGPRYQTDRQGRGPSPLASGGHLFAQGMDRILALNSFNGSILWSLEIPGLARYNVPRDCSNWCCDSESVCAVVRDACWRIDATTGKLLRFYTVPTRKDAKWKYDWGYVARTGRLLVGSTVRRGSAYTGYWGPKYWYDASRGPLTAKVCSDTLFAMDAVTGKLAWSYERGIVLNSTISTTDDRIYFVESRNTNVLIAASRRVEMPELWKDQVLVALDVKTGQTVWEQPLSIEPAIAACYMAHSDGHIIIVSSAAGKYHIYAHAANNGVREWTKTIKWGRGGRANHGSHLSRPVIVKGTLYVPPGVFSLATGDRQKLSVPPANCGSYSAVANGLIFRVKPVLRIWSRHTGKLSGWDRLRPNCWISAIPANGMLLTVEGGGGCSCGGWFESSFGFMPIAAEQGKPR